MLWNNDVIFVVSLNKLLNKQWSSLHTNCKNRFPGANLAAGTGPSWILCVLCNGRVSHGSSVPKSPGPWFNIKMLSYQYRKSHCGDKTVVSLSYIHNGISYTGKITYFYIAQIAPLSYQGSHRTQTQTSEVRWLHASVVTEWSPACLHKQFPGDLHRGN